MTVRSLLGMLSGDVPASAWVLQGGRPAEAGVFGLEPTVSIESGRAKGGRGTGVVH